MRPHIIRRWTSGGVLILCLAAALAPAAPPVPLGEGEPPRPAVPSLPLGGLTDGQATRGDQGPFTPSDADTLDWMLESAVGETSPTQAVPAGKLPLYVAIDDPWEGMNRSFFAFNDGFINWFIRPTHVVYKAIFPSPVRKSIRKAGHNLAWPVRLVNNLAQGKLAGAGIDTGRFLVNSTVGLLGFFDPAARMGMKRSYDEDFGQTFGFYGSGSGPYLVIPFIGPSSGRDGLGLIPDSIFNIATWLVGANTFFNYNDMTFTLPTYKRLMKSEHDPYVLIRDVKALARKRAVRDFEIPPAKYDPSPTLQSIFLDVRDPNFPRRGKTHKVRIPATDHRLPYTVWMQPGRAPIVFILPGTGSHRLSEGAAAMAEMVYNNGFSAVTISNSMNWEFMEHAATVVVPGYPPADARDIHVVLDQVYLDLQRRYPGRTTGKALLGTSLGGLHTLYIAAENVHQPGMVRFDRFLAINTPVDLLYSMRQLDRFYNAPMAWPAAERDERVENTLLKAVALADQSGQFTPETVLPFSREESEYLIGLRFRLILRDVIYLSQQREDMGVLKSEGTDKHREALYREIGGYSFEDYLHKFVLPYYLQRWSPGVDRETLLRNSNLISIARELRADPAVRIYVNENDFLLRPRDIAWLRSALGERVTVFEKGGHLGNLYLPSVQKAIMSGLEDLRSAGR